MLSDTFPTEKCMTIPPPSEKPDAVCTVLSLWEKTEALRFDVSSHSVRRGQTNSSLTPKCKHSSIKELSFFLNKLTINVRVYAL